MNGLVPVSCLGCGAVHWVSAAPVPCPACRGETTPAEPAFPASPERARRRAVDRARAARILVERAAVRFRCDDAAPERLAQRLEPVWWPYWLVDAEVAAAWQAEVGFDYKVKSSVEVYRNGTWSSVEQTDVRTRWEPRAGTLRRRYDDVAVPGLTEQPFATAQEEPARPVAEVQIDGSVRAPDRPTAEQWPVAVQQLRRLAERDCALAAGADRIREIHLDLDPSQAAWTWLLVPGWVTWYVDDDGRARVLRVDGLGGGVEGRVRMSPAKGRWWALVHGGTGLALLAFAALCALVGLLLWFLLPVALVACVVGLAECGVAWWCNAHPAAWNDAP